MPQGRHSIEQPMPTFGNGIALNPGMSQYPHLWDKYVAGFLNPMKTAFDPGPGRRDGTVTTGQNQTSPFGSAFKGGGGTTNIQWPVAASSPYVNKWKIDPPLTWVCNFCIHGDGVGVTTHYLFCTATRKSNKYAGWFTTWDQVLGIASFYWGDASVTTLATCGNVSQDATGWSYPGVWAWVTLGITVSSLPAAGYASDAAAIAAVNFWFDGFRDYGGKTTANSALDYTQDLTSSRISYFNLMGTTGSYVISPVMHLWSRVLSDAEMSLVTRDPLIMFRPKHWERRMHWGKKPTAERIVSIGGTAIKSSRIMVAG